jgi:predicted ester cyclase
MDEDSPAPFAALLRRYSYAYTASHDLDVCPQIMTDDYVLRMGEYTISGRDEAYIPATQRQFRQFPTLGFTVHDLVLGEDRAALWFTEHGYSILHGVASSWSGVSLYRWNGKRLTECRVEQDYYSRRSQQLSGQPTPVVSPALDPWGGRPNGPDATTEEVSRDWLNQNGIANTPAGALDDEHGSAAQRMALDEPQVTVLDLFTAGVRAAFHVRIDGSYSGGLNGQDHHIGCRASLYASGLLTVTHGRISGARIVTDRLSAERRMHRTAEASADVVSP